MIVNNFTVVVANSTHVKYAEQICDEMSSSAAKRGTGIAKRSSSYIAQKMTEGKAVIAFCDDDQWAGFTYIESWEGEKYVANSGLIINPKYREIGLAKIIKRKAFALSIKKYPGAKLFGLTTGFAVMKINDQLGYHPVTFQYLTHDEKFWEGCKSCVNYDILMAKKRNNCLCTAMVFDSSKDPLKFDIDVVLKEERYKLPKVNNLKTI
ncbi:MAG: GNAT family N-acetyltransferase [Rikenellaceae bacterium]